MRERLLEWLACPTCGGRLTLRDGSGQAGEIRDGALRCAGCDARYPIVRGIPRLVPRAVDRDAVVVAERFGYEWTRFAEIRPQYREQFLGWIAPVRPEAFAGRRVLDGGCGKGRHLRLAAEFGARDLPSARARWIWSTPSACSTICRGPPTASVRSPGCSCRAACSSRGATRAR